MKHTSSAASSISVSVLSLGTALMLALAPDAQAQSSQMPALQPPIDRKAWMVPSPSQPLRLVKAARNAGNAPQPVDYLRVLERFPLYGERGWRANYLGDPNLGFFGDPDSAEMGLRSMGNFIFVMSLLAVNPAYDARVSGMERARVLSRARSCLAYMTRSHVSGDIVCGDGKKWGNHWQSAWWTAKMALGAQLIWTHLSPVERERVERVVVHEASRHLARKAPSGAARDTKSEENAWDTEVMAAALSLFPRHPRAVAWRAKLIEFYLNSLSAPQDKTSAAIVDGKPLREQVYTQNIHTDFTIENHGSYHFCYMACPLHSIAWGHYALRRAALPIPQAQFHHFEDVWRRAKPTFLEQRFAYMEGKDWPRYAYGLSFIMPALVVLQNRFGDADARFIERARFRTFEAEQIANGDGSFFGQRFTNNIMMDRRAEYETDCYANLGACLLLHQMAGKTLRAPAEAAFAQHLGTRHISPEAGLSFLRTPNLFASFAWRMLSGPSPTAFFVPRGTDNMVEWGPGNLLGRIVVDGVDARQTLTQNVDVPHGAGFKSTGKLIYRKADRSPAYTHEISFQVRPDNNSAIVESRFVADAAVTVQSIEGLRLHVANDIFNGSRRLWSSERGARIIAFDGSKARPAQETISMLPLGAKWINIDNRLGLVQLLPDGAPFTLRQSNRRNSSWESLHYDVLDSPLPATGARTFAAGEEILHTRFLVMAGDARQTAAASRTSLQARR